MSTDNIPDYIKNLLQNSNAEEFRKSFEVSPRDIKERIVEKLEFHEDIGVFLRKEGYSSEFVKMKCKDIAEFIINEVLNRQ